jgi:hypothetical protein
VCSAAAVSHLQDRREKEREIEYEILRKSGSAMINNTTSYCYFKPNSHILSVYFVNVNVFLTTKCYFLYFFFPMPMLLLIAYWI